jgi:hypothetical protein
LLGSPKEFPVELTLSNGERYLVPHPDFVRTHPNLRDVVVYPENEPFALEINPAAIAEVRPIRRKLV